MTLEAAIFQQDPFAYPSKELYNTISEWNFCEFGSLGNIVEEEMKGVVLKNEMNGTGGGGDYVNFNHCSANSSASPVTGEAFAGREDKAVEERPTTRRKRRRTKSYKNKEEVESQRMTHIAVERNRRKQMNEYLAVLRSLMPASYAQRGDQASIVGGAINFVKELEQRLQTLESKKHKQSSPFSRFFTFPQYSTCNNTNGGVAADIEATMIESHVNLKVQLRRQPKQLLRMVMGLQSFWLTILHLNVTTALDQMVMYSFSLKVEDDCQLTSVDEIAAAVYQMIGGMQN
ncbi:transcription factor bHLH94-like [Asparagus officinalis]|uniref:transcription factor bHLH94-like n=1 Tax=Asparagus officinalis TaxID=4686 RepID=UPI00098E3167|nr:transcription factor bHLH94-like [Asparagus officinalis]